MFTALVAFSALTLLVGRQMGIRPVKNGGWWRWALVSPDVVAPNRMVSVSASVNPPLHHRVQKLFSGTSSPGWSRKKGRKTVVVCGVVVVLPVTQPTVSKHWRKLKALTPTSHLASSFLHPSSDFRPKRQCFWHQYHIPDELRWSQKSWSCEWFVLVFNLVCCRSPHDCGDRTSCFGHC